MQRMQLFWIHSSNSRYFKLIVFNAVTRSKMLYGLGSAVLKTQVRDELDAFHLKGLRKIFQSPTTYIDRTYTNEYVYNAYRRTTIMHRAGRDCATRALPQPINHTS